MHLWNAKYWLSYNALLRKTVLSCNGLFWIWVKPILFILVYECLDLWKNWTKGGWPSMNLCSKKILTNFSIPFWMVIYGPNHNLSLLESKMPYELREFRHDSNFPCDTWPAIHPRLGLTQNNSMTQKINSWATLDVGMSFHRTSTAKGDPSLNFLWISKVPNK